MNILQGFFISMIVSSSMVQAALPQHEQEIVVAHRHKWVVIKKMRDVTIVGQSLKDNQLKGFFKPEFLELEKKKYKNEDKKQ